MMKNIYVVGGQQKKGISNDTKDWHMYQKGLIIRVDSESGSVEKCVEYITPPDACAIKEDPSIHFAAGTVLEKKFYVCTSTEILIYELPYFERIGYISLPYFNELHHVYPTSYGSLLVANTGLDMVLEITLHGKVLREWSVLGEALWKRFSRDVDYRKVVTTKPHRSHPNFVFQVDNDIWVTRFEQRDVLCLTQLDRHIEIGIERPHDGIVHGESVYFTTVNGHIVVANLKGGYIEQIINLNEITDTTGYHHANPLGWCRGLKILDKEHLIVGFTKLRYTKWRENIRWVKRQFGIPAGNLPTRIALYDLKHRKLCWEKNLQEEGMDEIFSIHTIE